MRWSRNARVVERPAPLDAAGLPPGAVAGRLGVLLLPPPQEQRAEGPLVQPSMSPLSRLHAAPRMRDAVPPA